MSLMDTIGDPYVYNTQHWLNATYGNDNRYNVIIENGKTGWATIYALTRALQIELGLPNTADNFGPGTESAFNNRFPTGVHQQNTGDPTADNIYGIIQGALVCKGYDFGANTPTCHFYSGTGSAIISLKNDAGLDDTTSIVTLNIMKALLSMDYFYSYDTSERTQNIIEMQRYLNRNYESYIGIRPCDGIYGRRTNQALIFAIQAEESMPISVANGNFGPTTRNCCPTIPYNNVETNYYNQTYNSDKINRFAKLVCIGLYANGIGNGNISSTISTANIKKFQDKYKLPITGIIDLTTWLSIFVSCGDEDRTALACDCATILTQAKAQELYNNGYRYIGRYLSGTAGGISKALTTEEISIIFNAGLRFFPIYQTSANYVSYFTESQGISDAQSAYQHATNLGIPEGAIIYFAVDCDPQNSEIDNYIDPYFTNVFSTMVNTYNNKYKIGVYGTRNVCQKMSSYGYTISSFVSDISAGYSGNLGFTIPEDWAFDQFVTTTVGSGEGQIEIDKDGYSGRDSGIGPNGLSDVYKVYNNIKDLYRYALTYQNVSIGEANLRTLQYLRYLNSDDYDNTAWTTAAGVINYQLCNVIDAITSFDESDFSFYDLKNNSVVYDTLHFAATLNAILYETFDPNISSIEEIIEHFSGWAGDVTTFAKDIKERSLTQAQANALICSSNSSRFGISDYYADVDAVVVGKMMRNEEMSFPEAFFKYFMCNDMITGESYLNKRTTNFLNINDTYNTFVVTCNTLINSSVYPYPNIRTEILGTSQSNFITELEMASIAFLIFVGNQSTEEDND